MIVPIMDVLRISQCFLVFVSYILLVIAKEVTIRQLMGCASCQGKRCPRLPFKCELVREGSVCGCCLQCAKLQGESCGVSLGRCGRGLQCRPLPDDPRPHLALLYGTAVCRPYNLPNYSSDEVQVSRKRRCEYM